MGSFLNLVIDANQKFLNCTSQDDFWARGLDVFASIGSDLVTVGSTAPGIYDAPIVRTNLPQTLMDSYVSDKLFLADPWMRLCAERASVDRLDVVTGLRQETKPMHPGMRDLFADHGFRQVIIFPGFSGSFVGGVVLYASTRDCALWQNSPHGLACSGMLVSLFCARYNPENYHSTQSDVYRFRQPLTRRESEVLKWVANGLRTAQISEKMGIAEVTVSKHFRSSRKKLRAKTREHAVAIAMRDGLLSL